MEQIISNRVFKIDKKTTGKNLADEIYETFKKQLEYPRIMRMIKLNGVQCMREILIEVRKAEHPNKIALFLWMEKKYRTNLKEAPLSPTR